MRLLILFKMQRLNSFLSNDFIFSSRYRVWRHLIYWIFHITAWATFWVIIGASPSFGLFNMTLWVPVFMLFGYPLVYIAIPHLLLKGKVVLFFMMILAWGAVGLWIDSAFREYILIPLQMSMGFDYIFPTGPLPSCYLCMTTSAAGPMIIRFFKLCTLKQREWLSAQQQKSLAELQLLKAQVHPQFLFNTLNNIYSFSRDNSPKTPALILKLSSLLSYMLYDCKVEQVRLEKEIEIMKSYIDLERERFANTVEISWSVEGDFKNWFISPLLMLPFLENAFKYGVSEQIENPWLSVDIVVRSGVLRCKIANSKNEFVPSSAIGTGISNVKKRLEFMYSGKYDLKINDEGNFFVVSFMVNLVDERQPGYPAPLTIQGYQPEVTSAAYT
jgi:two-component system, LytTR family, sensor histidine kinase AlgZ